MNAKGGAFPLAGSKIYAFDVDDTLEISNGPIPLQALRDLRAQGHIVGLCGNWGVFTNKVIEWGNLISFFGPLEMSKEKFLRYLQRFCPAKEYILVGNDPAIFGASNDREAAAAAGWRFIREYDFAEGKR